MFHSLEGPEVCGDLVGVWADLFSAPCAGYRAHRPTNTLALGYLKATVSDYEAHPFPSLLLPCSWQEPLGIASKNRWVALMLSDAFTQGNLLLRKQLPVESHPSSWQSLGSTSYIIIGFAEKCCSFKFLDSSINLGPLLIPL